MFKKTKAQDLIPGYTGFCWELPNIYFFIVIVPHSKIDQFNIEIGWSREKRFPNCSIYSIPTSLDIKEHLFRLVDFTWDKKGLEPWWVLAPPPENLLMLFEEPPPLSEALDKIVPCLDEAMELIERHVMPLFRKVAKLSDNC